MCSNCCASRSKRAAVTIARAKMTLTFPSHFMLVAAMNPCPCGYFGDPTRECRCTPAIIQRYLGKISGPLLDRIDLHIEVPAVPVSGDALRRPGRLLGGNARPHRLRTRACSTPAATTTHNSRPSQLRKVCALDDAGERTLEMAMRRMGLSARAHDRILKVARTIADLDGAENVSAKHLAEAVQYRSLDRNYWT